MIVYPLNIINKLQDDITISQTIFALEDVTPFPALNSNMFNDLTEPLFNDLGQPLLGVTDWFYMSMFDKQTKNLEIVRVIGVDFTTNEINVIRGVGNHPSFAFFKNTFVGLTWSTNFNWNDLRDEFNLAFATLTDIDNAVALFLTSDQIQVLMDAALVIYEKTLDFESSISDFKSEQQAESQINTSITEAAITTSIQVQSIFSELFNEEVNIRELQSSGQVDETIDIALAANDFLTEVKIADNDEPIGFLEGEGTLADPLLIEWLGRDLTLLDDVPLNNTHRGLTNNPHVVTDVDVNCLTIGTPVFTSFSPTADFQPATKVYADEVFDGLFTEDPNNPNLTIRSFLMDVSDVGQTNGLVILGTDGVDPDVKFVYAWQTTTLPARSSPQNQGSYIVTLLNPLDDDLVAVSVILDSNNIAVSERARQDANLYVADKGTNFITIIYDVGKNGKGLQGNDLVVKISYWGVKTIV